MNQNSTNISRDARTDQRGLQDNSVFRSYEGNETFVDNVRYNSFIINRYHSLCGQPGFCSNEVHELCFNTPLYECGLCHNEQAVLFIFFVICLGLAILLGNILIVLVGYRRYKSGQSKKLNIWKISLAIADLLIGKLSSLITCLRAYR